MARHKRYSSYNPYWQAGRKQKSLRKKRRVRRVLLILLLILLIAVGCVSRLVFSPAGRKAEPSAIYLTEETTFADLTHQVDTAIGLRHPAIWELSAKAMGLDKQTRKGRFMVDPSKNIPQLVYHLLRGGQAPVKVTFNHVRTQGDLVSRITKPLAMPADSLLALLTDPDYCSSIGVDTISVRCLFLPLTHEVYWDISPRDLMQKYIDSYQSFWTAERQQKAKDLGLTPHQVHILASIVEEESIKSDEHGQIARLYLNRLQQGMKLQADPTVKYALEDFTIRRIRSQHLIAPSRYNTYQVEGLPPGTIRYPEPSTIDNVLDMPQHDYLYMCAKSDFSGYHVFARTYSEHLVNAALYRDELNKRDIN